MKLNKPDRFERIIQRRFPNWRKFLKGDPMLSLGQAAELLRQEHAWMRRMVRGMVTDYERMAVEAVKNGYDQDNKYTMKAEACKTVLSQLDQRRK